MTVWQVAAGSDQRDFVDEFLTRGLAFVGGHRQVQAVAHLRFKNADSEQKRELIKFMCSNSSWVDGKLEVELHEFFDLMLNLVKTASQNEDETVENGLANVKTGDWWR